MKDNFLYDTNPELDRYTIQSLVEHVIQNRSHTYFGKLADMVGEKRGFPMSPQGFYYALERIQDYCDKLKLPSISVMVFSKESNAVGKGFIEYYKKTHPDLSSESSKSDKELIEEQYNECLTCTNWQKLYDSVGITDQISDEQEKSAQHYREHDRILSNLHKEYNRNPAARDECLREKGYRCIICGRNLEEVYGLNLEEGCHAPGLIHVHHLKPFSASTDSYIDPKKDLIPVCPNCHVIIHSKRDQNGKPDVYDPNEVREMLHLPPLEKF